MLPRSTPFTYTFAVPVVGTGDPKYTVVLARIVTLLMQSSTGDITPSAMSGGHDVSKGGGPVGGTGVFGGGSSGLRLVVGGAGGGGVYGS
jgi:hypothetical protein